jgi:hypothetical protein
MTIDQMSQALKSVGACFAVTSAKTILPNDGFEAAPSYHIHPDAEYPHEKHIKRVYSQKQLQDWVRTMKAVQRIVNTGSTPEEWEKQEQAKNEKAFELWFAYDERWS